MLDFFRPAKKRAIDALATELAEDVMKAYPAEAQQSGGNKKAERQLSAVIDNICAKARDFHAAQRLDLYSKARLNNTLLWHLRENGYESTLTDEITKKVIIALSAKAAKA